MIEKVELVHLLQHQTNVHYYEPVVMLKLTRLQNFIDEMCNCCVLVFQPYSSSFKASEHIKPAMSAFQLVRLTGHLHSAVIFISYDVGSIKRYCPCVGEALLC